MGVLDYKFKLIFENISGLSEKEITEPVKFDGASFVLEQDKERFGRDIFFLNENVDLFFYNGVYDYTENPQQLLDGTIINNLTQGFESLIEARKQKGYEVSCKFLLLDGDTEFTFGVLDFQTSETDEDSYIKCKVLQSTEKQVLKRRADYVVDVFSDETPDEEYIEPLTTQNILLKANPSNQVSKIVSSNFDYSKQFFGSNASAQFPIFNQIQQYDIEDTLTSFYEVYDAPFGADASFFEQARQNLRVVRAVNDLSNINIKISNLNLNCSFSGITTVTKRLSVIYGTGYAVGQFQFIDLFYSEDDTVNLNNQDFETTIDFVPAGGYISVIFSIFDTYTLPTVTPSSSGGLSIQGDSDLNISLTATAIDTVIKGVRWIDIIKQNIKSISGLDVYAPLLDVNGKHYDNFAFSGNLIKGRNDVAFNSEFKDLMDGIKEVALDYQVLDDKVYIGHFTDFYPLKELGSFPQYPSDDYTATFNDKTALNLVEFEYSTYEKSEDEEDTSDGVHTSTQWTISNLQVENTKKLKIPHIRDFNKIEVTKQEAVKVTTVTGDDDKMYMIDVVPLAPNSRGGFSASMTHNVNSSGQVQLLKSADLPSWGVLGFSGNSPFTIESGVNVGTYTVEEITDTIITLNPVSPSTQNQTQQDVVTEVSYPYDNVLYTNRTNEGFSIVDGIISPDKSANLRYTPKRNLLEWERYFASAVLFTNNKLKNSEYKVNQYTTDGLSTQLETETELLNEKAKLELNNPLLSANEYNLTLVVSFTQMVDLLNKLNTINEDDSIGGFIRCYNPNYRVIKGFIKKLDYEPATERLNVTLEELYETELIEITSSNGDITINNVLYDVVTNDYSWFEFNGDYFIIFDSDGAPIINPTLYSNISFNGVIYDNVTDLNQVLLDA